MCRLDAAGAALGTTLSQTISVVVALAVITRRKTGILLSNRKVGSNICHILRLPPLCGGEQNGSNQMYYFRIFNSEIISLTKKDFKPHVKTMQGLLKIGVPVALQDGFIQIAFIVITVIANRRGLNDAAAVGIVEKIIGILFLVPSSMLSTVSALSAQNIGAGKYDRARLTLRYAIIMSVTWGIAAVLVMQLAAEPFVSLFVDKATVGSAEVIRLGGQYMRGYVWDCVFAGVHFSFSGYFCACGLSVIPFIHNSISILCARIPLSYFASRRFPGTLLPMGLASPAGSLVSVVICVGVFIWMNKKQFSQTGGAIRGKA